MKSGTIAAARGTCLSTQHAGPDAGGAALREQRLGESKRAARIEDVVDDHDVAARESLSTSRSTLTSPREMRARRHSLRGR